MRVLFDTYVTLDLLLDRAPFAHTAASLIARVESGNLVGYIGATTVTTIHYLATQSLSRRQSRRHLGTLLDLSTSHRSTNPSFGRFSPPLSATTRTLSFTQLPSPSTPSVSSHETSETFAVPT